MMQMHHAPRPRVLEPWAMSRSGLDVEAEIDGLNAVPLGDFVKARDALAARLKVSGRGADAARVKASKKPGVPAWAVNQLRFAEEVLIAGGHAATPDLLRRISSTLEAVVVYGNASGRPVAAELAARGPSLA